MRKALHLLTGGDCPLALPAIERQLRDPDTAVTIVLLHEAPVPALPDGVAVRRIDQDLTYGELLDLIFESDQVITW